MHDSDKYRNTVNFNTEHANLKQNSLTVGKRNGDMRRSFEFPNSNAQHRRVISKEYLGTVNFANSMSSEVASKVAINTDPMAPCSFGRNDSMMTSL